MSVVGCRYAIANNAVVGTLDLWRIRGKMPFRMHEKRQFTWEKDGLKHVIVLDISRHVSVAEHLRYDGDSVVESMRFRVRDMYLEDGLLTVGGRHGEVRVGA